MKPKKRKKLCYNCEGEIDLDVIVCPFCAADLREQKPDSSQSLYSPLGFSGKMHNYETSQSLYPPPFPSLSESTGEETIEEKVFSSPEEATPSIKLSHVIFPTILFTLGIQLFLLGMFILLFLIKGL